MGSRDVDRREARERGGIVSYNTSVGSPNRRAVHSCSPDQHRDLPKSYAEARELYRVASVRRGGAKGLIAHNTYLERRDGGGYAVRLHDTYVVTFYSDGSVELDSGGWQTPTTRDRMNRCGLRVSMSGGVPSVSVQGTELPYADGIRLRGSVAHYPKTPAGTVQEIRARRRRVLARARRAYERDPLSASDPFYWPNRTGGFSPYCGTVPEAFEDDRKEDRP